MLDAHQVGFFIGNVIDSGSAGNALGIFLAHLTTTALLEHGGGASPGEVLTEVNRRLLALGLDERPLAALLLGTLQVESGELKLTRAGLPAPILLPGSGELQRLAIPGPFLGTGETTYSTVCATMRAGDKFVAGTDGTRIAGAPAPDDDRSLHESLARHRSLTGQSLVDAAAHDLVARIRHTDDLTLLCVEWFI